MSELLFFEKPGSASHSRQRQLLKAAASGVEAKDVTARCVPEPEQARLANYVELMKHASSGVLSDLLAKMLASMACGEGAMPLHLGLGEARFRRLFGRAFESGDPTPFLALGRPVPEREEELDELITLFLEHAAGDGEVVSVAAILAHGCMGNDHLWQDLGVWSRADLSQLIKHFFPALARKNDRDMKWKKFFYKQLCQREGVYTCRAPSCAVCKEYADCFSPEA